MNAIPSAANPSQRKPIERIYPITVYYSDEDESFVAVSTAWPFLSATGETSEEALREMQSAIAGALEVSVRHGDPIPDSDPVLARLLDLKEVLNTSKLAKLAKINENTLRAKLRRSSGFTPEEAGRIKSAFEEIGVALV